MDQPVANRETSEAMPHWEALSIEQLPVSDAELLELYRCSGSKPAINTIVRRHSPLVASVIRRLISNSQDAEDAFQATFLVLILSAKKIRNPDSLGAWLYGVAYRTAKRVRSLRRKGNAKMSLQSTLGIDLDSSQSPVEEPLAIIARELQLEALDDELSKLPKHLREALIEHYLSGNSVPEIARCLQLSVSAVEGRLKRGRSALRLRLAMRGISFTVVAAACVRFQQDVVAASAQPWSSRFLELYGSAGIGHPSLPQLLETKTVSSQLFKLVKGELVVNSFSRSVIGVTGGILLLCALGTIGFLSALANQQSGTDLEGANGNQALMPDASSTLDSGDFVLAQAQGEGIGGGMGGIGGGGMGGGMAPGMPKELVLKWEKPASPTPSWLDSSEDASRLEEEEVIRMALNRRVDVNFNAQPLSGVIKFFDATIDITFMIDLKSLDEEGLTPDEPITMNRPPTRVRDALPMILNPLGLRYVIEREAVIITSAKANGGTIRFYDLSYILTDSGLTTEIITLIEGVISPDKWQNAGGNDSITRLGSMLVVKTDEESHLVIESILRAINKQSPANLKPRAFLDKPASKPAENEKGKMGGMM